MLMQSEGLIRYPVAVMLELIEIQLGIKATIKILNLRCSINYEEQSEGVAV